MRIATGVAGRHHRSAPWGFAGIWPFRDPPEFELLYGVAEPLWGQGDAVEVSRAVLAYCYDTLDMSVGGLDLVFSSASAFAGTRRRDQPGPEETMPFTSKAQR